MRTIKEIIKEIQKWQVEEMGNTCSICYGSNAWTKCDACGWWGRVKPKDITDSEIRDRVEEDDILSEQPEER